MRRPWLLAAAATLLCRADGGKGPAKATLCVQPALIIHPHPTPHKTPSLLLLKGALARAGRRRSRA